MPVWVAHTLGLAMPIEDFFRGLNLSTTDADIYAAKFTAKGLTDAQALSKLGLTHDDLRELRVNLVHRQLVLDGIRALSRTASPIAEARQDLVRRFFPVALSVGFVARLVEMPWIKDGSAFDYAQGEQLARLLIAVFIVVSGWEWYHRDIGRRPLEKPWRFAVDVLVVIATVIFLYSSKNEFLWLLSLLAIFFLYVLWDMLSICEYPADYSVACPGGVNVIGVYGSGFLNGPRRGPITNLLWLIYFLGIAWVSWKYFWNAPYQAFIACFFVWLGVVLLRVDGNYPRAARATPVPAPVATPPVPTTTTPAATPQVTMTATPATAATAPDATANTPAPVPAPVPVPTLTTPPIAGWNTWLRLLVGAVLWGLYLGASNFFPIWF
jgi:hypothetical protein